MENGIISMKRHFLSLTAIFLCYPSCVFSQVMNQSTPSCCKPNVHPSYCACLRYKKVVNTRWRTVPMMSYRKTIHTSYRPVARVEQIPLTTYRTVLRDEGEFRTIWVPRIVPRTVSQTSLHTRIRQDYVPEQTIRRQPVWSRRLVPEQHINYVPYWSSGYVAPSFSLPSSRSPELRSSKPTPIPPLRTNEPNRGPRNHSNSAGIGNPESQNSIQGPSFVFPSREHPNRTQPVTSIPNESAKILPRSFRKQHRATPTAARVWRVRRAIRR